MAFSAAAQDETAESILQRAVIPLDWEFTEIRPTVYRITQDNALIIMLAPEEVQIFLRDGEYAAPREALAAYLQRAGYSAGEIVDTNTVPITAAAEISAPRWGRVGLAALIETDAGRVVMLILTEDEGVREDQLHAFAVIALSFQATEALPATPAPEPTIENPCMVMTLAARSARVHVGPESWRTAIAFLQPGLPVLVEGKLKDRQGADWYRVDKAAAAPGKAINEAWVIATGLEQSGNCASVPEVDAPPVIRVVPQPTAQPPDQK